MAENSAEQAQTPRKNHGNTSLIIAALFGPNGLLIFIQGGQLQRQLQRRQVVEDYQT